MNELQTHNNGFSLQPDSMGDAMKIATMLSNSQMVPKFYQGRPEDTLVAMMMGHELKLNPIQSLQNIAVINGRPAVWGDAMLAIVQNHPKFGGINGHPFRQEYEDCLLCGKCVRMCEEQMMAKAIGFRGRGEQRSIGTPFDIKSDECRTCGGCMYVCPACELRCTYTEPEKAVCGGCANIAVPCVAKDPFDDMMCFMDPCVACEIQKD